MKLERFKITTPAREIRRTVLSSLTSRFPNETRLCAIRGDFEMSDLEAGIARRRSSSQLPREAPIGVEFVESVRQIWAAVESAGQVRS